jgi:uncharacterized membrane protein required for colicin V production
VTWFDIVVILLVILIAWVESVRGFGRALLDFVGALISLRVALFLAPTLARAAPVVQPTSHAEAFWMVMVFVVLAALTVIAGKYVYESTLLSLDVLDPIVGGILGTATGLLVGHLFLRMLLIAYGETEFAAVLTSSFTGQELVEFRSYLRVVTALQNISNW